MDYPGLPSLFFLAYLFVLLPYAAVRSAGRLRASQTSNEPGPGISRERVWASSLVSQGLLFALVWLTGQTFGFQIFAIPALGPRELVAALGALLACFAIRAGLRVFRTDAERRELLVFRLAPRTPRENLLWAGTVIGASIAEEAAYRGVAMSVLWYSLGNPYLAALLCALAFALAHFMQGWKSGLAIFAIALVMHALVVYTETLVLAMIVHAIYDLIAGFWISAEAARFDRSGSPA